MTINFDGVVNPLDKIHRAAAGQQAATAASALPSVQADHVSCPGCGKIITDTTSISKIVNMTSGDVSSLLVVLYQSAKYHTLGRAQGVRRVDGPHFGLDPDARTVRRDVIASIPRQRLAAVSGSTALWMLRIGSDGNTHP